MTDQQVAALQRMLGEWLRDNPWVRAAPGEGEMTTSDTPWECYACYADVDYVEPDHSQPRWWEMNLPGPDDHLEVHHSDCRWLRSKKMLNGTK